MRFYHNKSFAFAGKIFISILILFLLTRTSQLKFGLLWETIHKPFLLLGMISLFLIMVVVSAWRWYTLNAAQEIRLSFLSTVILTYTGLAFNYVLPGSIGGDFVRLYSLFKKLPGKKSNILSAIFFDRVIGLMGVFSIICFIALTHLSIFSYQYYVLFYLLWLSILICIAGFMLFIALKMFPNRIGLSR